MTALGSDFDSLAIGERFTTRGRTIAEADIVWFAAMTGDRHPQHTDAGWAARSPFGERVAHGMLVLSYAIGLAPFDPERVVALRGVRDVAFKRPARIGDTVHVDGEVAAKREIGAGRGLVSCRLRIVNQHGALIARATVEVIWRGDEPPPVSEQLIEPFPGLVLT
jgi:acyl dehydratase